MNRLIILILGSMISYGVYSQPGMIDLTFNANDMGFGHGDGENGWVYVTARQPDGKIYIGGGFTAYNGIALNRIARLNRDGSVDHTFNPGTGFSGYSETYVYTIEILVNGKILVGGKFNSYNGQPVNNLVMLNPDGSIANEFNPGNGPNNSVRVIRQQTDEMIVIGGNFSEYNGISAKSIVRLFPDGSIDDNFIGPEFQYDNNLVQEILLFDDGKIMLGGVFIDAGGSGNHYIVRLLNDGSVDTTFNTNLLPLPYAFGFDNGFVGRVIATAENKFIAVGRMILPEQEHPVCIIRFNEDGSLDDSFQIPLITPKEPFLPSIYTLYATDDGKFICGGNIDTFNGIPTNEVILVNNDGTLDTTFNSGELETVYSIIPAENGQLIVIADFVALHSSVMRINEDFTIDYSFNMGSGANHRVYTVAVRGDNKTYLGGRFNRYNGEPRRSIARLLPNGNLDPAFNPEIMLAKNSLVYSIVPYENGKVIVAGYLVGFDGIALNSLIRLNEDGSIDQNFNTGMVSGSRVNQVAVDENKNIIAVGAFTTFNGLPLRRIIRLNPDGSPDDSFNIGQGADNTINCMTLQSDGKIIIGGDFGIFNEITANRIARLNTNGSLDTTFATGQGFQGRVNSLGIQSNGKIVVAGDFSSFNSMPVNRIVRLNPNGSIDNSFSPGYGPQAAINNIIIQPDDKIVIGGRFTMFDNIPVGYFARLNADGSLDTTFRTGTGFNDYVETLALLEDGNILVGGWFTGYDGTGRNRIAKIIGVEPDGVPEIGRQNNWIAFPNPTNATITIKGNRAVKVRAITLYNIQGVVVQQLSDIFSNTINLDLSNLPPSVYLAEILEKTQTVRIKIVRH